MARISRLTALVVVALLLVGAAVLPANAAPSQGLNDWSCRPSPAHPNPVVLVHGFGATGPEHWVVDGPLIARHGYCVFWLTYGVNPKLGPLFQGIGGLLPVEESAQQLADFVARVRSATQASKVDIVGHSEGSFMPDYFVKFLGGAAVVQHYVAITPLWQGTNILGLGTVARLGQSAGVTALIESLVTNGGCGSCTELLPGAPLIQKLNEGGAAVAPVSYTTLITRYDQLVTPYTSGYLQGPNVTNIVVQDQCPLDYSEHIGMAFDPIVAQDIFNALDPAHAQPPACTLVLPLVG
jgi:triacylglycerol esterase/lipase EstA (alpha/beta hydrolase family)